MSLRLMLSVVVAGLVVTGCGQDGGSSSAAPTVARGGMIAGNARTSDGRPIEKFDVSFDGWPEGAIGGMDGNGRITSPASGHVEGKLGAYEIKLPPGQYTTSAEALVTWHDRLFHFKLEPADGSDDSARAPVTASAGLTRDYVWKMTGPRPGRDVNYLGSGWERNVYGASIAMDVYQFDTDNYKPIQPDLRTTYPNDSVEFTLVPKGKLIDGSDGKTIVDKVAIAKAGQYGCGIRGIPVGDYTLSAKVIKQDGTSEPLRVSLGRGEWVDHQDTKVRVPWAASLDLVFEPEEGVMAYYGAKPITVYVGK